MGFVLSLIRISPGFFKSLRLQPLSHFITVFWLATLAVFDRFF
ncbi:hypothetical protein NOR51B_1604 [Luminiphilus syltensis NOR5-1B]|uniref:Uncharacterized protein n=1 Tax=Luminiphilus syltensis NOR5-1B TaxID=565045 RepID=B8KXJ8_9GAMM|nr:hypothetical protein NOR51B_1604 [Luminiphilus syltensis NOR5-1B]